jgi:hypothetical protein
MFIVVFPASAQKLKKDKTIAVLTQEKTNGNDKVIVLSRENKKEKEKKFTPEGIEFPHDYDELVSKYNVQYIPVEDLIVYERPYFRERNSPYSEVVREKSNPICSVENIECNENETLVTLKTSIYHSWNWLFVDKKTCLIDTLTGDRYMLRDIQGVHEPGLLSIVYGLQGKAVLQTLVFPPLKKTVEVVDYYEPDNYKDTPVVNNSNAGGYREYGIVVSDYTKQKKYPNAEVIY